MKNNIHPSATELFFVISALLWASASAAAAAKEENHFHSGLRTASEYKTCKRIECPAYEIIDSNASANVEIRRYRSALWVTTDPPISATSLVAATRTGFLKLFWYISGGNVGKRKIDMTAPVATDVIPSDGPFCDSQFMVSFYVPSEFQNEEGPPAPLPGLGVKTKKLGGGNQFVAVRQFSGFVKDSNAAEQAAILLSSLANTAWVSDDATPYVVAQYNSPFEFRDRLNEIWLSVSRNDTSFSSSMISSA